MADNNQRYGFRFVSNIHGGSTPPIQEKQVASGYSSAEGGGTPAVSLGDPVQEITGGNVVHADDSAAPGRFLGVVQAVQNARVDANGKARPASFLPNGQTYVNEKDTSRLGVTYFGSNIWEVDVVNAVPTTKAGYQALVGMNADMTYVNTTLNSVQRAGPVLDLTTPTTATQQFRIVGISKTAENADFSGAHVKMLVQLNEGSEPVFQGVGI